MSHIKMVIQNTEKLKFFIFTPLNVYSQKTSSFIGRVKFWLWTFTVHYSLLLVCSAITSSDFSHNMAKDLWPQPHFSFPGEQNTNDTLLNLWQHFEKDPLLSVPCKQSPVTNSKRSSGFYSLYLSNSSSCVIKSPHNTNYGLPVHQTNTRTYPAYYYNLM